MSKSESELKSLVVIVGVCYTGNMVVGWVGYLSTPDSVVQLLMFQIGAALAISASVMAGRYTGLRGQQVAASAYILLGITHGISLAALGRLSINADRGMTMVMPMIPALAFMFWCDLYPKWLRMAGVIPIALFTLVYINVHRGITFYSWPLNAGFVALQILEILWAIYLYKDWQRSK